MPHRNKTTFEWMNAQRHWQPNKDLYTVVCLKNGKSEMCMTEDFNKAWEYMEKNKDTLLYFYKMFGERKK
jgi:hypothetical protein